VKGQSPSARYAAPIALATVREQIARQISSIAAHDGTEPAVELRAGNYVQAIGAVAREIDADLIMLGSHRRRAMAPLIGTTAERTIVLVSRPALLSRASGWCSTRRAHFAPFSVWCGAFSRSC
jgi:nucleotide-binding universal stress UspA family protein